MRYVHGVLAGIAALLVTVPVAAARSDRPAVTRDDVTAAVGQPVTLDGEQVHTVVQVQRWYGGGYWLPPAGQAAVTIQVRIHALQKTSYNALYYSLQGANQAEYGRVAIGTRDPSLVSSNDLLAGNTVEGWLTFLVPQTRLGGLRLVYGMHSGYGSTLTVPLGNVPDSQRAKIGKTAVLAGEQALTVRRVERPATFGIWKPKSGHVFITVDVRLKALKATKTGSFTALTVAGKPLSGTLLGHRTPTFPTSTALGRGKVVEGWVTLMVPKAQAHRLTLVYHLSGYRDTLLVPLPG